MFGVGGHARAAPAVSTSAVEGSTKKKIHKLSRMSTSGVASSQVCGLSFLV